MATDHEQEQLQALLDSLVAQRAATAEFATPEEQAAFLRGQLLATQERLQALQTLHLLRTAETQALVSQMAELSVRVNTLMAAVTETLSRLHMDVLHAPDLRGEQLS